MVITFHLINHQSLASRKHVIAKPKFLTSEVNANYVRNIHILMKLKRSVSQIPVIKLLMRLFRRMESASSVRNTVMLMLMAKIASMTLKSVSFRSK